MTNDIPGWISNEGLEIISSYSSKITKNGIIVEIGSFVGRTTSVLAKNHSCNIFVFDPLPNVGPSLFEEKYHNASHKILGIIEDGDRYNYMTWAKYTQSYKNIFLMREYSPPEMFQYKIDLLVIDGDHGYDSVKKDLEFWVPKVKDGGVVILDDYDWPDVKRAVHDTIPHSINESQYSPFYIFSKKSLNSSS